MECILLGLRVSAASHGYEDGTVAHVWQSSENDATMCVVVFDDGDVLEFAATALKAKKS